MEQNQRDDSLTSVINKTTVLAIISILSNLLAPLSIIIRFRSTTHNIEYVHFISNTLISLEIYSYFSCIALSYSINDANYHKFCGCFNKCFVCCQQTTSVSDDIIIISKHKCNAKTSTISCQIGAYNPTPRQSREIIPIPSESNSNITSETNSRRNSLSSIPVTSTMLNTAYSGSQTLTVPVSGYFKAAINVTSSSSKRPTLDSIAGSPPIDLVEKDDVQIVYAKCCPDPVCIDEHKQSVNTDTQQQLEEKTDINCNNTDVVIVDELRKELNVSMNSFRKLSKTLEKNDQAGNNEIEMQQN